MVLAVTYKNQGRWKEAQELSFQVKDAYFGVFGEEHPDTPSTMEHIAVTSHPL